MATGQKLDESSKTLKKKVGLFSHLDDSRRRLVTLKGVHPRVVSLAYRYADFSISGSNNRCLAMLSVFKQVSREGPIEPGF